MENNEFLNLEELYPKSVSRTQSNIYDEAFLRK